MKNILIQTLLVLGFCSASAQGVTEIDIPALLKTERDPVLSEIASDIRFIKLETTPQCLIQSVGSITEWGDNYLVSTYGSGSPKSLFQFTKEGKFVKPVGRTGKGPGEFLQIFGMVFDPKTDHLFILDNGQVKLMEFDETAKFVREFKLPFYATGVKVTDNGFIFYTGSVYAYRTDGCLITVTDRDGKVLNRYHKRPLMKGYPDRNAIKYGDGQGLCYWEQYWDTVYAFNGTSCHPKYYFKIGKNRIPQDFLKESDMFSRNVDPYTWVTSFSEYGKFLSIRVIDKNRRGKMLFYDKDKKTGYCIPGENTYYDWGFVNDFCGGLLFTLTFKPSKTESACAFDMTDLKEFLAKGRIDPKKAKSPARCKELTDLINKSAADDNPVIMIAKLK